MTMEMPGVPQKKGIIAPKIYSEADIQSEAERLNNVIQQNNVNQVIQQSNVNQVMQQANIVQQNNPYANTYVQHKHWSRDGSGPETANNQEMNNSLHSKGYTHNEPSTNTAQQQQQTSTNATGNSTATNKGGGVYANKGQSNQYPKTIINGGGWSCVS